MPGPTARESGIAHDGQHPVEVLHAGSADAQVCGARLAVAHAARRSVLDRYEAVGAGLLHAMLLPTLVTTTTIKSQLG